MMTTSSDIKRKKNKQPQSEQQRPRRRRFSASDVAYSIAGVAILLSILLIWQIVSITKIVPATVFPPASTVLVNLFGLVTTEALYVNLGDTLIRLAEGYALAGLIGVAVGIPMGLSRKAELTGDPLVQFLRPMPSAVLIPLAILYFGLGDKMIVSLVTYACIWPVLINTMDGVKSIDSMIIDTSDEYGVRGFAKIRKVVIPASAPFIFSGLRVSLGVAWIVAITAEVISTATSTGIGALIFLDLNRGDLTPIYSLIIVVAIVAYCLNRFFLLAESRIIPWHGKRQKMYTT